MSTGFYASRRLWTTVALLVLSGASLLQAQAQPYRVEGDVQRPVKISGESPAYPELARKARVTGVVILEAIINKRGNVTDIKVVRGLRLGLTEAAVEAVRTWKFKPATLDGRPVPVYYTLTINFDVEDPPPHGPRFEAFLEKNPDFATLFQDKRYGDAMDLLDRRAAERPDDPEIRLARSYLFLEQAIKQESWQEALDDRASAAASPSREVPKPVQRPERISGDFPQITEDARKAGVSGTVIVKALIDERGTVQDARILKGLREDLDREALRAVRTWKFKPATQNGKPVEVHYNVTLNFQ